MYSLRKRDLSSLLGGVEASEAAKAELWLDDFHRDEGGPSGPLSSRVSGGLEAREAREKAYRLPQSRARPGSSRSARTISNEKMERLRTERTERAGAETRTEGRKTTGITRTSVTREVRGNEGSDEQLRVNFDELSQAYKDLKARFDRRGAEMAKLHERIRKLERDAESFAIQNAKKEKTEKISCMTCQQPCCIPIARLEKAGLNAETVQDLDAKWAGYVFSILSGQARTSGRTLHEIFRKYADAHGRIDEAAFRNLIRQFIPSMPEERLTRLFYFADTDGSGMLNLLEFLRLFGVDVDGKMGEEYFEHVMIRMRKAIARPGGLVAVLKLQDRYLNRSYPRNKLIDTIAPLAPSLTRSEIFEATARFVTAGEAHLQDVHDAMELCASSAFVSEDWVHKLFKAVSSSIQRQHKDLKSVLKAFGPNGTVSREDLRAFLQQFQPNLGDSHIDRVYGFLCASCLSGAGNLTVSHLVETICRPTLGPVQMGSNRSRLPLEDTSRLAVQLAQLCGGLDRAFESLNPCLLYEEFCTALQSLGFSHAFDFEKIFAVIDVHRSGRVPKAVFMSVLERFVQTIEEDRAKKEEKEKQDEKHNDVDERLQYFRESLQHRRQMGRSQAVPAALHEELLWEFQRAVNRLLVLESELQIRQKQEERDDIHMRRGLIDQVRDLEAAQARLTARKPQLKLEHVQRDAGIPEAWNAGYKEGRSASASEIAKLQHELDIAKEEKIKLQLALQQDSGESTHVAYFRGCGDPPSQNPCQNMDSDPIVEDSFGDVLPELSDDISDSTSKVKFRRSVLDLEVDRDRAEDRAEGAMREALKRFAETQNADEFALTVKGISIAGRFFVKEVLAVEFDAIALACGDAFNMREVTLRMPLTDGARIRLNFLKECCIYTVLSEVAEVQDVIHFPGLTSGLAYCVMERLHGRLLSNHLQCIRRGQEEELTAHAAADICDAMLHGLEACHARGVCHLDLKPSVIWEVAQPSGVVVKILDFGMARLANLTVLPADAKPFFRPGNSTDDRPLRLQFDAEASIQSVPGVGDVKAWKAQWNALAPFAYLSGVGSCWYMSPSRFCNALAALRQRGAEQPQMRLCNVLSVGNLWLERAGETDHLGVSKITASSPAIQGAAVAMQLPMEDKDGKANLGGIVEGAYFEIQIRKVWPSAMLPPASDLAIGPAIGFTQLPPQSGFSALNARAKDWPLSWVVGYDGRVYQDRTEKLPSSQPSYGVLEFRRNRDAKLSAAGSGEASIDWPSGPLGWSFVELLRDDVLGLLAKRSGELIVYVNGRVVSSLSVEGLEDSGPLYPLVEVCGVVREVAFTCRPAGPGGEEERDEVLRSKDQVAAMVESLATRSTSTIADVYAAALIAQQVFQSHTLPQAPMAFIKFLVALQQWLEEGRPDVSDHNGMLISLTHWALAIGHSMLGDLPLEIRDVLKRVLESSNLQAPSSAIRSAGEFRAALNEQTACSHVPAEFLRSHVQTATAKRRPTDRREEEVLWDLTPWTLSSSHIRRVMVVLQSDGQGISFVKIGKLEANIPDQLLLHFAECFEGPHNNTLRRTLPKLLFREFALPADACPSLARICEANAAVLLLRFVRKVRLNTDLEGSPGGPKERSSERSPFVGLAGAKIIGSALRENLSLEDLNASCLHLEDRGIHFISEALSSCHLLRLELAENRISSQGVQVLGQAVSTSVLRHLELRSNQIGCQGCAFLADMLKENTSLEYLGLQRNGIGASGATELGTALISNGCLEELDLGRNAIGAAGCGALAAATRSNACLQKLNLQDNGLEMLAGTALAEEFGLQQGLEGLWDTKSDKKRAPKREGPAGSHLASLNLRHNDLGSLGGAAIVTALRVFRTHLSELNLAWNGLGLEAAAALASLMGSQSLSILTKLDLRDNRGLGAGAVFPKALHRLALSEKEDSEKSGQHLHYLHLANIDLDNDGAALLAPAMALFPHLEEFYLYNNVGLSCGPRVLERGEAQEQLMERKGQGICRLARALPASLTTLDLGSCSLGPSLVIELLGILGSRRLQRVGLCDNDLGDGEAPQALHAAISRFACTPSLKCFDLSLNNLGDECAMSILRALQTQREPRDVLIEFGANRLSETLRESLHSQNYSDSKDLPEQEAAPWIPRCFRV